MAWPWSIGFLLIPWRSSNEKVFVYLLSRRSAQSIATTAAIPLASTSDAKVSTRLVDHPAGDNLTTSNLVHVDASREPSLAEIPVSIVIGYEVGGSMLESDGACVGRGQTETWSHQTGFSEDSKPSSERTERYCVVERRHLARS